VNDFVYNHAVNIMTVGPSLMRASLINPGFGPAHAGRNFASVYGTMEQWETKMVTTGQYRDGHR
jgi:hypothetical protein